MLTGCSRRATGSVAPAFALALALVVLTAATPSREARAAVAGAACDRACLEKLVNTYLDALVARDPKRAPLAANAKYSENQSLVAIGDGRWKTAEAVGTYRIYAADPQAGQVGFIGTLREAGQWSMIALRLRIVDQKISEIEAVIPGETVRHGSFGGFDTAPGTITTARAAFSQPLLPAERRDRGVLINVADSHYEGVERGNGDIVPFSDECIKVENGVQLIKNPNYPFPAVSPTGRKLPNFAAMGCRDQFNTHIWETDTITDRRYPIVDQERGIVMAFVMYHQYDKARCASTVDYGLACPPADVKPYTLALVEAFKIESGEIHEVEAVFTVFPDIRRRGVW
jgi:hypothetical protein